MQDEDNDYGNDFITKELKIDNIKELISVQKMETQMNGEVLSEV